MEASKEKKELELELRPIQPGDAPGIINVFHKAWLDTYPNAELNITKEDIIGMINSQPLDQQIRGMENKIEEGLKYGKMTIATVDGEIVGHCNVSVEGARQELNTIYILPEYQGRGIGQALWQAAQQYLDKNKDVILSVASYNNRAIDFYNKLGFVETGEHIEREALRTPSGKYIPEIKMVLHPAG